MKDVNRMAILFEKLYKGSLWITTNSAEFGLECKCYMANKKGESEKSRDN